MYLHPAHFWLRPTFIFTRSIPDPVEPVQQLDFPHPGVAVSPFAMDPASRDNGAQRRHSTSSSISFFTADQK